MKRLWNVCLSLFKKMTKCQTYLVDLCLQAHPLVQKFPMDRDVQKDLDFLSVHFHLYLQIVRHLQELPKHQENLKTKFHFNLLKLLSEFPNLTWVSNRTNITFRAYSSVKAIVSPNNNNVIYSTVLRELNHTECHIHRNIIETHLKPFSP